MNAFIAIKTTSEMQRLREWALSLPQFNTWFKVSVDKKGNDLIKVGFDRNKKSDYSRIDDAGLICFVKKGKTDAEYKELWDAMDATLKAASAQNLEAARIKREQSDLEWLERKRAKPHAYFRPEFTFFLIRDFAPRVVSPIEKNATGTFKAVAWVDGKSVCFECSYLATQEEIFDALMSKARGSAA